MNRAYIALVAVTSSLSPGMSSSAAEFSANRLYVMAKDSGLGAVEFSRTAIAPFHVATGNSVNTNSSGGIAFGPDGNLYVASWESVLVYDANDTLLTTIQGGGVVGARGIAFGPGGDLFVVSAGTDSIVRYGRLSGQWLLSATYPIAGAGSLSGLAFASDGHLFVSDSKKGRIYVLDLAGNAPTWFSTGHELDKPEGLAFSPYGLLHVAMDLTWNGSDFIKDRVFKFTAYGFRLDAGIGADSGLDRPEAIAFGPNGNLYVSAKFSDNVIEFDATTYEKLGSFGTENTINTPIALAFVPQRFRVKVGGLLVSSGSAPKSLKENAILSIAPGSRTIMLAPVNDDPAGVGIAEKFQRRAHVFHSEENARDPAASLRVFGGAQAEGTFTLSLTTKGKVDATGNYLIKSIGGSIGLHQSNVGFNAGVKAAKLLNKPTALGG